MKSGKLLLGILAGAAIGALVGIIVAPQKGSKTRRKIMNGGEDYLDDMKDKFDDFLNTATGKLEKAWKETQGLVSSENTKHLDGKKEVENKTI